MVGVRAPTVSFATPPTGSAGLVVGPSGTPAAVVTHGSNIVGTHPAVGTIEYLVGKLPAKSEENWVVEIQRTVSEALQLGMTM